MGVDVCVRLGRRIRSLRAAQGIYQADMAEMAGISRITLSRIENGKMEPGFRIVARLARALGVSLPELMEGVD
jgi:transcriptional regulator with XRE-family HTH domain